MASSSSESSMRIAGWRSTTSVSSAGRDQSISTNSLRPCLGRSAWKVAFHHAHKTRQVTASLGGVPSVCPPPNNNSGRWSLTTPTTGARLSCSPTSRRPPPRWRSRCIPNGVAAHASSIPTASIKNRAWMSKTARPNRGNQWRRFVLVLLAALFVYHIAETWPHQAVLWLRRLGGKLGLNTDADGPLHPARRHHGGLGDRRPRLATPTIIPSPDPGRLMGNHHAYIHLTNERMFVLMYGPSTM